MEKLNERITLRCVKIKNAVKESLNNERGDGLLAGLIFTALVVLAVIAMKPSIDTGFTNLGNWFRDSIIEKVKSTLS